MPGVTPPPPKKKKKNMVLAFRFGDSKTRWRKSGLGLRRPKSESHRSREISEPRRIFRFRKSTERIRDQPLASIARDVTTGFSQRSSRKEVFRCTQRVLIFARDCDSLSYLMIPGSTAIVILFLHSIFMSALTRNICRRV